MSLLGGANPNIPGNIGRAVSNNKTGSQAVHPGSPLFDRAPVLWAGVLLGFTVHGGPGMTSSTKYFMERKALSWGMLPQAKTLMK